MCEQRRYTMAVHEGGSFTLLPHPTHAQRSDERDDGEGYRLVATAVTATATAACGVWLYAAQLSAGRTAVLQRAGGAKGWSGYTEKLSLNTPSPSRPAMHPLTDDTHV